MFFLFLFLFNTDFQIIISKGGGGGGGFKYYIYPPPPPPPPPPCLQPWACMHCRLFFNSDVEPAMRKACEYDDNTDVVQFS